MESHQWSGKGINFLYLTGNSPYEIGFSHGQILKDDIEKLILDIKNYTKKRYGNFLGIMILNLMARKAMGLKQRFSKDLLEEMRGIKEGSKQQEKWVLLANTIYEIGVSLFDLLHFGNCSSFIGNLKDTSDTIVGKTTDMAPKGKVISLLTKKRIVYIYDLKWLNKKFITLSFPMTLAGDSIILRSGTVFCINDGGFAYKKINFRNLPITACIRKWAENSDTPLELFENLKKYKTMKTYTCMLTTGKLSESYQIDLCQGDYDYQKPNNDHLINTNHFISQKMINKHYKKGYREDSAYIYTWDRYQNLEQKIDPFSHPREAIELLKLHNKDMDIETGSVSNALTVQGIVFYPKEKKLYLPSGEKTPITLYGHWYEFEIDKIFNHQP